MEITKKITKFEDVMKAAIEGNLYNGKYESAFIGVGKFDKDNILEMIEEFEDGSYCTKETIEPLTKEQFISAVFDGRKLWFETIEGVASDVFYYETTNIKYLRNEFKGTTFYLTNPFEKI